MASYVCSTPELSERNFCGVFEMKVALPLRGVQAGAPETAAKKVLRMFLLAINYYKRLYTVLHFIIINFHTELTPPVMSAMIRILYHLQCTQHLINHGQLVNHTDFIRFD